MAAKDAPEFVTSGRQPPKGPITYEEFLDWCDEDTLAEWVNGEVQLTSPAALRHQELDAFLLILLSFWVQKYDLGLVLPALFQMRLSGSVNSGREPDILYVAKEHLARLRRTYLDGPADLVVEITSPESLGRDRGDKFVEYERAGIPEYWLLDPDRRHAEFYQLGADSRYRVAFAGIEGRYESAVLPGFALPVEWLWQEPLPSAAEALRTLGILP